MDRGVGYTPYGEHFMMQCGMEIVLADGTSPLKPVWAELKILPAGLFLNGDTDHLWMVSLPKATTVSVQEMGIWLMPEPPAFKPFCITFDKIEDVVEIVESLTSSPFANL